MPCRARAGAGALVGIILLVIAPVVVAPATAATVTIDWVDVADPDNACDPQDEGCFGAVSAFYRIAETEVTNAQYVEFLNAVAASDPNGLYNPLMANAGSGFGGINRSGSAGSYSYAAAPGSEDLPVNHVSFYDALRFANWMHNGQLSGAQDATTTEDGAYTFTGTTSVGGRNAGASIFLPTENEWYKAAYYDVGSASYFDFPAGSDATTTCAAPGATPNTANCGNVVGDLTDVGSYTGSLGPNGTLDQGGNVWEWLETTYVSGAFHAQRGGSFDFVAADLGAGVQRLGTPTDQVEFVGFRVAMVPEPGTGLLLSAGLLGLALRARRRA